MDMEDAKNEVLRKIGRNMLLFQQVEQLLKFLISYVQLAGYGSELKAIHAQRFALVSRQSMGQLVGQFLEGVYTDNGKSSVEPAELREAYISFSFRVDGGAAFYEAKKQALALMVAERNDLIHHLLPRFDANSLESCNAIGGDLDRQRERLIPEINDLKRMSEALQESRKELAAFLSSDDGQKQFEREWLRQSRLALLLGDIARQAAQPDGWTLLTTAGRLLREQAPKEVAKLAERYGHKTLKALIEATGVFDVKKESTGKGGVRILYRLTSE